MCGYSTGHAARLMWLGDETALTWVHALFLAGRGFESIILFNPTTGGIDRQEAVTIMYQRTLTTLVLDAA